MTLSFGTVHSTLDLKANGKRAGFFSFTHSNSRYGFSTIQSPLSVIVGGDGPTVLVCGGNHGDEYEGQIIVRRLFETLDAADLCGRLILAPSLNMPAVQAISRTSPFDDGNLNRSFTGVAFAGPTQDVAGFVATHLIAEADLAIDIHSGGKISNYLDTAYFCLSDDPAQNAQTRELANVMGLPYTMVVPASDTHGDFDSAAHAAGCAMISCELGGEAKVSVPSLNAGWHSVLRLLAHQGVLRKEAVERLAVQPQPQTIFLDLGENGYYVTAQSHGMIEPLVCLGEKVTAGQTVMLMRDLYKMDAAPQVLTSDQSGIVSIIRTTPIVAPGDHLCVICPVLSPAGVDAQMTAAIP
jgi:predicted deacylase